MNEEIKFLFCPNCLSRNVGWNLSKESYAGGRIFNEKTCKYCGFKSLLFPEVTAEEYKNIKQMKAAEETDTEKPHAILPR